MNFRIIAPPRGIHQQKKKGWHLMRFKKTGNPLRDLVNMYPITRDQAFKISRVHRTTFDRWWDGKSRTPAATLELIRLVAMSELPGGKFEGWRVAGEFLIDANGSEYHHDDIRRIWFYKQMWSNYKDLQNRVEKARKVALPGSSRSA